MVTTPRWGERSGLSDDFSGGDDVFTDGVGGLGWVCLPKNSFKSDMDAGDCRHLIEGKARLGRVRG